MGHGKERLFRGSVLKHSTLRNAFLQLRDDDLRGGDRINIAEALD